MDITTTLLGIMATVMAAALVGGVPWAYSIHGRLTHIEAIVSATRKTTTEDVQKNAEQIRDIWRQIADSRERLIRLENHEC